LHWFLLLCNVTLVNLILSGDNALAISMAAGKLPLPVRKKAIVWGSVIAILLLILFIAVGTYVIQLPILKSVAGLLLLWIAIHLVLDHINDSSGEEKDGPAHSDQLWKAIRMIAIADVVMSLDNAVAMLGVANGRMSVLMVSLLIAIPFLIFGSHFIATLLQKFSWIIYVAATYIAWIAGGIIADDPVYQDAWSSLLEWMAPVLCVAVFLSTILISILRLRRRYRGADTGSNNRFSSL
jgi:YjbE family integral membrane protein